MAHSHSAKKRVRQNEISRVRNRTYRSKMRTAVKKLRSALDAGNSEAVSAMLPGTLQLVDETAQKGVIHRNAAARTKSRLTRAANSLEA